MSIQEHIPIQQKIELIKQILDQEDWLDGLAEQERQSLERFFSVSIDVGAYRNALERIGKDRLKKFLALGLEPHYLPPVACEADAAFPEWLKKPADEFWNNNQTGRLLRNKGGTIVADTKSHVLEGQTVLIDARIKPDVDPPRLGGMQRYENDNFLGPILQKLRKEGILAESRLGEQSTRFNISRSEWERVVRPAVANAFAIPVESVRLERAIEANIIPQLYPHLPRQKDGETSTYAFYEEYVDDANHCLVGGSSDKGGLGSMHSIHTNSAGSNFGIRPIIIITG